MLKILLNLLRILKKIKVPNEYNMISLDVVSLFTNIPIDIALQCIKKKWDQIKIYTELPLEEFLCVTKICLNNAYCNFNNIIYKQIFGTPMGLPLSSC